SALTAVPRARRRAGSGGTARLSWMLSFRRGNETPSRTAKAACEMASGLRNSSRSISPGEVGGRVLGRRRCTSPAVRLVVVGDFDVVGIAGLPPEADPVLIIDANAVLSQPVFAEPLQSVAGRHLKLGQVADPVQLVQLATRDGPQRHRACGPRPTAAHPVEEILGSGSSEGPYHGIYYNGRCYS